MEKISDENYAKMIEGMSRLSYTEQQRHCVDTIKDEDLRAVLLYLYYCRENIMKARNELRSRCYNLQEQIKQTTIRKDTIKIIRKP